MEKGQLCANFSGECLDKTVRHPYSLKKILQSNPKEAAMTSYSSPTTTKTYPPVDSCPVKMSPMLDPVRLYCCKKHVDYAALMDWKSTCNKNDRNFDCPLCSSPLGSNDCKVSDNKKSEVMLGLYLNPPEFQDLSSKEQWMVKMWWAWHREEIEAVDRIYHDQFGGFPEQRNIVPKFPVPQNLGTPGGSFPAVAVDRIASKLTRLNTQN